MVSPVYSNDEGTQSCITTGKNIHTQVFIIQFYIAHLIIFEWKRKFNSLQSQYIVAGKIEYSFNNENKTANKSMLDVNKGGGNFHSCYTVF